MSHIFLAHGLNLSQILLKRLFQIFRKAFHLIRIVGHSHDRDKYRRVATGLSSEECGNREWGLRAANNSLDTEVRRTAPVTRR